MVLTYHIKAPLPRGTGIPHQVKFKGKWSLTKNHDLRLTLDKWGRQTFADQLTLEGDIIDVDKNSLLFAIATRSKENIQSLYVLKLQGSWQADKNNRLTFRVKKQRAEGDILTFDGIWEINKNQQIIYSYERAYLATKLKKVHTLIFKGYWDIKEKMRLSYIIDKATDSTFDFKTSLGLFKGGYIKYELGIGRANKLKPIKRIITLLFNLRNALNKDIGTTLELSHKLLKGDGEAFLRLLESKQESAILAGAGWRW